MTPKHTHIATIALVAVLLVAAVSMPVAADSDETTPTADLLADDEDVSPLENPRVFAAAIVNWATGASAGLPERVAYEAGRLTPSDDTEIEAERDRLIETVDDNEAVLGTYVTNHSDLTTATLHEVRLVDQRADTQASFYLRAHPSDNGTIERVSASVDKPDNMTVEQQHRVSGQLAATINDEAQTFIEDYAVPGNSAVDDGQYLGRLASQYGGIFGEQFESTLMDDGFEGFDDGET